MAIPKVFEITLPLLKHIASGEEFYARDLVKVIGKEFSLTDEEMRQKHEKSGTPVLVSRIAWSRIRLKWADLIESTDRGYIRITQEGKKILSDPPPKIDHQFLMKYPIYVETLTAMRKKRESKAKTDESAIEVSSDQTPEDLMATAQDQQERAVAAEILDKVRKIEPKDFEHLILALLEKMGYGETQHLGGGGDGGVDGVIEQDRLGLDRVYIQAKRYQEGSSVGPEAIQAFSGSLNMKGVQKGLFVTSSSFSSKAREAAQKLTQNIVIIDGEELAQLMIEHNVGVRVKTAYEFKDVDEDFFENL